MRKWEPGCDAVDRRIDPENAPEPVVRDPDRSEGDDDAVGPPPVLIGSSPYGLAYGAGSIWVTNESSGTVSRIDPARNRVTKTTRIVCPALFVFRLTRVTEPL